MRDLQEAEKKNRYDSAATEREVYVLLFPEL